MMRPRTWLFLLAMLLPAAAPALARADPPAFTLTSPGLAGGGTLPMADVHGRCGGDNLSPPLEWRAPPPGTRSFAVTMFDRDAAGGFWHWIIFNIPVGAHGLNADAGAPRSGNAPGDAVQLDNDFGNAGYSGPCPPPGKPHHYVITVYALDAGTLGLAAHVSGSEALARIQAHTLAKATLTVVWGR